LSVLVRQTTTAKSLLVFRKVHIYGAEVVTLPLPRKLGAALSERTTKSRPATLDAWLREYGREAVTPTARLPSIAKQLAGDCVVAFVDLSGTRVVAGSPVGPDREKARRELFAGSRRVVVFGRELEEGLPVPDRAYVVGELPWWELSRWPETVRSSRSLRSQIRRARHKGVQARACGPEELVLGTELRNAIEALTGAWLRGRHLPPLGFLATVDPFALLNDRCVFVAELGKRVVGAVFAIPIGNSGAWLLDHVVRDRSAPNGTAELLVDAALTALGREGATRATLGLCPLAGRVPRLLVWVLRLSRGLFDFRGLYAFKAKLKPQSWQRVLLEHPKQSALLATLRALRAFAGGSLIVFGLRAALRGPPPLLRLVALLLLPWTLALAHPAAERFFPSPVVRGAWIVFDLWVMLALLWLAQRVSRRHRKRWLHVTLAILISLDALLTGFEALSWNVERAVGFADALWISCACVAPAGVAVMLWSALRFRDA
jgi:phosphatidylglycerol lysyltransferase